MQKKNPYQFDNEELRARFCPEGSPLWRQQQRMKEMLKVLDDICIPDTVTKIGTRAFLGCKLLKTVVIPASVKEVGEAVFGACPALQEIKISKKAPCLRALKKMLPKTVKLIKV